MRARMPRTKIFKLDIVACQKGHENQNSAGEETCTEQ